MSSPHSSRSAQPNHRFNQGLTGLVDQETIVLPLKAVDTWFAVIGDFAEVHLDQVFHQTTAHALDVVYSFPLPAKAAVFRCELIVNGRVIQARVEERQRARDIAKAMKDAGHRVGLVEQERDNLFTLSLGNVQPNDLILVRFAWFEPLYHLQKSKLLRIPFTPGVRYIPGTPLLRSNSGHGLLHDTAEVPDASRISPPRIDQLHPEAALVSIAGIIHDPLALEGSISSPSHPLIVRENGQQREITLAPNNAIPDRDFVLRWEEGLASELAIQSISCTDEEFCYTTARIDAPADLAVPDGASHDYYFLLDRSGSMHGQKWTCAVQALGAFLGELGSDDRFWVTFFESGLRDFAERPLPVADVKNDQAFQSLEKLGVTGGTELLPALEHIFRQISAHSIDRRPVIVLITDGQVGNEAAILRLTTRYLKIPIHTFGIDTAVNDALLKELSARHAATSVLLTPNDNITAAVSRLGHRLRRPVLTNLTVSEGWEATHALPDLHAGEHLLVTFRGPKDATSLQVTGSQSYRFEVNPGATMIPRLLWARERIDSLLANGEKAEAIKVSVKHNLICRDTAFIAYDLHSQAPISSQEFYQPSLMPHYRAAAPKAVASDSPASSLGSDYVQACDSQATRRFGRFRRRLSKPPALDTVAAQMLAEIKSRYPQPADTRKRQALRSWMEDNQLTLFAGPVGETLLTILLAWAGNTLKKEEALLNLLFKISEYEDCGPILEFIRNHISEANLEKDCVWLTKQL